MSEIVRAAHSRPRPITPLPRRAVDPLEPMTAHQRAVARRREMGVDVVLLALPALALLVAVVRTAVVGPEHWVLLDDVYAAALVLLAVSAVHAVRGTRR
ncbi:MAG: hypothetical protein ACTHOD_16895 [Motilibacteraceae bacterium]